MRRHHHLYPPKLFLGNTTEIHDTLSEGGHVNASVIFNIATSTTPRVVRTYNKAPGRRRLSVRYGNELVIIGCGIEVCSVES